MSATRMDVNKWRIQRHPGGWKVLAPGFVLRSSFWASTWAECVAALPVLQRAAARPLGRTR